MKLVIFGTSEIGRCAYEYFTHDSEYEVVAFTVDKEYLGQDNTFEGLPLVAFEDIVELYPPSQYSLFIAVGSQQLNRIRQQKYIEGKARGYKLASYVSSKAFVWHNVIIGDNAFILENNTLQPYVRIGDNVTLWSGNHIGHSSCIDDHCFVASHVVISGMCHIGVFSFLGVNVTISNGVKIGRDSLIGMSTIVSSDMTENVLLSAAKSNVSKISAKKFCKVIDAK